MKSLVYVFPLCLACVIARGETNEPPNPAKPAGDTASIVTRFVNSRTGGSMDEFVPAVEEVKRRAEAGVPLYRFLLAIYSEQEPLCRLTPKDKAEYLAQGRPSIVKSAKAGNSMAQYLIGLDYAFNRKDMATACTWLERSASQGEALAQNSLGLLYFTGNHVPQNWADSIRTARGASSAATATSTRAPTRLRPSQSWPGPFRFALQAMLSTAALCTGKST